MSLLDKPLLILNPARMPWGIHYSWVIVGVLAVVEIFGSSVFFIAGIMVSPLSDQNGDFGWSVGIIGAAFAVYYIFGAIYAPISGYLGDRFGARRMMLASIVMYGAGMAALGFINEVWQLFLIYSVFMSATATVAMVPLMAAISGWFRRRMGVAIGIMWAVGASALQSWRPCLASCWITWVGGKLSLSWVSRVRELCYCSGPLSAASPPILASSLTGLTKTPRHP